MIKATLVRQPDEPRVCVCPDPKPCSPVAVAVVIEGAVYGSARLIEYLDPVGSYTLSSHWQSCFFEELV